MLATFLLAFAAAPGSVATRPLAPTDKKALAAIESYLESAEFFGWSGVVLLEADGKVVFQRGYGSADVESGVPNDVETVFEIASVTKPFTACAILALADDGKIDLDESIARYLPGVPEARHDITVRHLLAHTSGMPRLGNSPRGLDLAVAVEACFSSSPTQKPGVSHEYWNQGYALLAGIIENVTEEGYLDYLRERIFARAGLKATGFTGDTLWPEEQQAIGYAQGTPVRRAAGHPYGEYGYQYRGMGGIVTSVEELWKLGSAAIDGKLLKKSTTREMLTEVDGSYGLGWALTKTERGTRRVGHGGDVRGFHTSMNFFPDEKAAVIVTSSVEEVQAYQLGWNLETLLLADGKGVYGPPRIAPLKASLLEGCAATYRDESGRSFTVSAVGPGLELIPDNLGATSLMMGSADSGAAVTLADQAKRLMLALVEGDSEPVAAVLAEGIPPSWPSRLAKDILPLRVTGLGDFQRCEPLLCEGAGLGPVETCYLRLHHELGSFDAKFVFRGGKLGGLDFQVEAPIHPWRFAVEAEAPGTGNKRSRASKSSGDEVFRTHNWDVFVKARPTLRFKPSTRKPEFLVLDIPGVGEVSLPRTDR